MRTQKFYPVICSSIKMLDIIYYNAEMKIKNEIKMDILVPDLL